MPFGFLKRRKKKAADSPLPPGPDPFKPQAATYETQGFYNPALDPANASAISQPAAPATNGHANPDELPQSPTTSTISPLSPIVSSSAARSRFIELFDVTMSEESDDGEMDVQSPEEEGPNPFDQRRLDSVDEVRPTPLAIPVIVSAPDNSLESPDTAPTSPEADSPPPRPQRSTLRKPVPMLTGEMVDADQGEQVTQRRPSSALAAILRTSRTPSPSPATRKRTPSPRAPSPAVVKGTPVRLTAPGRPERNPTRRSSTKSSKSTKSHRGQTRSPEAVPPLPALRRSAKSQSDALRSTERHALRKILFTLALQRELEQPTVVRKVDKGKGRAREEDDGDSGTKVTESTSDRALLRRLTGLVKPSQAIRYFLDEEQSGFAETYERCGLSTASEQSAITARRLLTLVAARYFGAYLASGTTTTHACRPDRPDAVLMKRIDSLYDGTQDALFTLLYPAKAKDRRPRDPAGYASWVAVVGRSDEPLNDPEFTIITSLLIQPGKPRFVVSRSWSDCLAFARRLAKISRNTPFELRLPGLPGQSIDENTVPYVPDRLQLQRYLRLLVLCLSNPPQSLADRPDDLDRARDVLEGFLLDDHLTDSIPEREERRMLATARMDDDQAMKDRALWLEAGRRVRRMRTTWTHYKEALLHGSELRQTVELVKQHERIRTLPKHHRDLLDWLSMQLGYLLHYLMVVSPLAADTRRFVSRVHELLPYSILAKAFSVKDPQFVLKSLTSIFLSRSGFDTGLFSAVVEQLLDEDIITAKADIERLRREINDDSVSDALRAYVLSPLDRRDRLRKEAESTGADLLLVILGHSTIRESTRLDIVKGRERYFLAGGKIDLRDPPRALGRTSKLYRDLKLLLRAYSIKRDREELNALLAEDETHRVLRSLFGLSSNVITKLLKATSLADRVDDLKGWMEDLIATASKPKATAVDFIKLVERHMSDAWTLLHEVMAHDDSIFGPLLDTLQSAFDSVNDASSRQLDFDAMLDRHAEPSTRAAVIDELAGHAFHSRLRKLYIDILMRCSYLGLRHGLKYDPVKLFGQLLADPELALYGKSYAREGGQYTIEETIDWSLSMATRSQLVKSVSGASLAETLSPQSSPLKRTNSGASARRRSLAAQAAALPAYGVPPSSSSSSRSPEANPLSINDKVLSPPPRLVATSTLLAAFARRV